MLPFEWTSNKQTWNEYEIITAERALFEYMGRECEIMEEKKSTNTNLDCYAVPNKVINEFVSFFLDCNYIRFLEVSSNSSHPMTLIRGQLISHIEDPILFKKFLDDYTLHIDSWAHCDFLKINIEKITLDFLENILICEYIHSNNIFRKRIALLFLNNYFLDHQERIKFIFECIAYAANDTHCYVYNAVSNLLYESYIKESKQTLEFLQNNALNNLITKSFLDKCKKTTRINKEDYEKLASLLK